MIGPFGFEDSGRTFHCAIEQPRAARAEAWWWFEVSGDAQRYAPFRALSNDTQKSVRARVIEYYRNLLERRAMPHVPRQHWARRAKPGETPASPAVPAQSAG
jgi:hypothetical protein